MVVVSRRFDRLFRRLASARVAYESVPRTPERLPELARRRAELDRARDEIAEEREVEERWRRIVASYHLTSVSREDIARLRVDGMIVD